MTSGFYLSWRTHWSRSVPLLCDCPAICDTGSLSLLKHFPFSANSPASGIPVLSTHCPSFSHVGGLFLAGSQNQKCLSVQFWALFLSCDPGLLTLHQSHWGHLSNTECWDPPSELLVWWVRGGAWDFALITHFRVMAAASGPGTTLGEWFRESVKTNTLELAWHSVMLPSLIICVTLGKLFSLYFPPYAHL